MIASKGGSLQDQMRRAEAYAQAEVLANPQQKKQETFNAINAEGHMSQISLSGALKVSPSSSDALSEEIVAENIVIDSQHPTSPQTQTIHVPIRSPDSATPPAAFPFRDPQWESTELPYLTVAIADLNSKTRSYNLQAPDLAKKPYFSLQRELDACYADIAPQLATAIRDRAVKPVRKVESFGQSLAGGGGGVMDRLVGEKVRVRDERVEKQYGLRQFWKDIWAPKTGV